MTPEQAAILLEQNAQLLKQNQELIGMLKIGGAPAVVAVPRPIKVSRRQAKATAITSWYNTLSKRLSPEMAAILKKNIQKRDLWQN